MYIEGAQIFKQSRCYEGWYEISYTRMLKSHKGLGHRTKFSRPARLGPYIYIYIYIYIGKYLGTSKTEAADYYETTVSVYIYTWYQTPI